MIISRRFANALVRNGHLAPNYKNITEIQIIAASRRIHSSKWPLAGHLYTRRLLKHEGSNFKLRRFNTRWISSVEPNKCDGCGDLTDPWRSPINIKRKAAKPSGDCPPLLFQNYWHSEGMAFMYNNGKTVELKVRRRRYPPVLCGGPLPEPYLLDHVRFHWGPSNQQGSEHYLNGERFSMEVHLVHYASSQKCIERAYDYKKGITVVAMFLQASASVPYFEFEHLVSRLNEIRPAHNTTTLKPELALAWLRCRAQNSGYFTYTGTLTDLSMGRDVIWIVYPNPLYISESQVDQFRMLRTARDEPILNNCMAIRKETSDVRFCEERGLTTVLPR